MDNHYELELLSKGRKFYEKGDLKKAQSALTELIETNNKSAEAFFLLANIFHLKGEISKAIKAFKKVLAIDPEHTDASISLSVIYNDIGKYDEAKEVFNEANTRVKNKKHTVTLEEGKTFNDSHINKKFAVKHFELADLYYTYNRLDEALYEYNKAINLDPDDIEARIKVAKVYAKKGLVSKAFQELKKLKNEYPNFAPARLSLGILYYSNGHIIEAQNEWQRIIDKDPANEEAKMYLRLSNQATETSISI